MKLGTEEFTANLAGLDGTSGKCYRLRECITGGTNQVCFLRLISVKLLIEFLFIEFFSVAWLGL